MKRLKQGFTLTEMLMALLILSLISGVMVFGMRAASTVYYDSLFVSESETLSTTVNLALSDILRYASSEEGQTTVSLTNTNYDIQSGHFFIRSGCIFLTKRADDEQGEVALLNPKSYSSLKIQDFNLEYQNKIYTGSYKITDKSNKFNKVITFTYRTLT